LNTAARAVLLWRYLFRLNNDKQNTAGTRKGVSADCGDGNSQLVVREDCEWDRNRRCRRQCEEGNDYSVHLNTPVAAGYRPRVASLLQAQAGCRGD
jgi:hypothetical protein